MKSVQVFFRLCLIPLSSFLSPPLSADTYALLIGIDKYNAISSLQGAKNDANHIHQALVRSGIQSSNIRKLTDYAATRQAIKREWTRLINLSKPGDFLILSFAGHGTSILDRNGDERIRNRHDNHDEAFLLSKYRNANQTPNELLLDDELGRWFDQATRLRRNVIFVADACFAGGGFRKNSDFFNKGHVRYSPSRELAPPKSSNSSRAIRQSPSAFDELGRSNNFLFISGVQSNQVVKEILLPNPFGQRGSTWRGALSYAFAEAIFEGLSVVDRNRDNGLSPTELRSFIKNRVRGLTSHNQNPDVFPSSGNQIALQVGPRRAPSKRFKKPMPIKIYSVAGSRASLAQVIPGAMITKQASSADLYWDNETGEVSNKFGDVITTSVGGKDARELETRAKLNQVLSRTRLMKSIQSLSYGNPIALDFEHDIRTLYKRGDVFSFTAKNLKYDYLLVFNIAGNGLVECANHRYGERESSFNFQVSEPFGNDSLILLNIQSPPQELLGLLGSEESCVKDSDYLMERLPQLLAGQSYHITYTDRFSVE